MGRFVRRNWRSSIAGLGIPRRDRAGGPYRSYVPDTLVDQAFLFSGDVSADLADAAMALARLDRDAIALTNTEAPARLLLRAESVASSYIEGLVISPQRLLRAENKQAEGIETSDLTAKAVLANVDAMEYAVAERGPITVARLLEVHRRLLEPTRASRHAGVVRTEQNWIGGSSYNPIGASFVPPPPADVPDLLDDLCAFANGDNLPAVAQAAIAHAQFETIHPFADGNGRTGRALIHMILRRRGLTNRTTPPVSLVLATRSKEYIARLDATRSIGRASSEPSRRATNDWIAFFAAACIRAVADAEDFERRVAALQADWRSRLAGTRSDSTAFVLLNLLPAAPIITANAAAKLAGRTFAAANNALAQLEAARILTPVRSSLRNRAFEARELIDAFTDFERRLSSPVSNTRIEKPARAVPARPRR